MPSNREVNYRDVNGDGTIDRVITRDRDGDGTVDVTRTDYDNDGTIDEVVRAPRGERSGKDTPDDENTLEDLLDKWLNAEEIDPGQFDDLTRLHLSEKVDVLTPDGEEVVELGETDFATPSDGVILTEADADGIVFDLDGEAIELTPELLDALGQDVEGVPIAEDDSSEREESPDDIEDREDAEADALEEAEEAAAEWLEERGESEGEALAAASEAWEEEAEDREQAEQEAREAAAEEAEDRAEAEEEADPGFGLGADESGSGGEPQDWEDASDETDSDAPEDNEPAWTVELSEAPGLDDEAASVDIDVLEEADLLEAFETDTDLLTE